MKWSIRAPLAVLWLGTLVLLGCERDQAGEDAKGREREQRIEVTDLSFKGVEAIDEGRLRNALVTAESSWLPWGQKRDFDRLDFEADLRRIEAFYADRGYPDARVASFDLDLNDAQDAIKITIEIAEGQPTVVEEIVWNGFDPIPAEHLAELRRSAPLQQGMPHDTAHAAATSQMAINELRDHGYPYASADARTETSGERQVRYVLSAQPGPIASFGPIQIEGNVSVGDTVIRRELAYRPGELFRISRVQETQRRLFGLELFQFVNVEPRGVDARPAEVPTRVMVTEGKHRRLTFGIGYGTEEDVRGDIRWQHVNWFGGARTLGIRGKWSSLDRGVRLEFNQPYLLHRGVSLGVTGHRWFADEPAYDLDSFGGRVTVSWQGRILDELSRERGRNRADVSFIYTVEDFAIASEALLDLSLRDQLIALGLDPRTGAGRGTLGAIALDVERSTTPNLLDARRGYVAMAHLERAGGLLPGDFRYTELTTEFRHYLTLIGRGVLANRLRFGTIAGPGTGEEGLESATVPFFKRYFLGGSSSLRGWGRFEVSPLSGSGLPIGGLTMMELTTELRIPLFGKLGGVVFLEGGNAWPNSWDVDLGELRYDVGPGLRYDTPVGPVRFDVGYQLNPIQGLLVEGEPERRRWRVHFSIGQAF